MVLALLMRGWKWWGQSLQWVPGEYGVLQALSPRAQEGPACMWRTQGSIIVPPQDAKEKMEQLEGALQGTEAGQDLCSSRRLQKQHRQLESQSQALATKMAALVAQAHRVVNPQPIMEETQKLLQRYSPARSIFTPPCVTLPCEHKGSFTQ